MTDAEARALHPGDRIRLKRRPTDATNPPERTTFVVAKVDIRAGGGGVRVVSVEGFGFTPWEIERAASGRERDERPGGRWKGATP